MYKCLLLAVFLPAVVLARTPVRQCGNGAPLPEYVDINGCTTMPCHIRNGEYLDAIGRGIQSRVATGRLLTYINARMGIINLPPIPIPEELEDACVGAVEPGTCPIEAGQVFDFRLRALVSDLPNISLNARIEVGMRAEDGSHVACVQFDARFVR